RMNPRTASDNAIGCYGKTVVVRTQPKARQTFRELLGQVRESVSGALAHQRVSVDTLVRESNRDRDPSAARMAQVGFGFYEPDGGGFCPPGVRCERGELRGQFSQLPLGLMVEPARIDGGALVEAEYLVEVLDASLVQ